MINMIFFFIVFGIFILAVYRKNFRKAKIKTAAWAIDNGWKLIAFKQSGASRDSTTYRFTIADGEEKERSGKITFSAYIWGVSDPSVNWDDRF